MVHPKESKRTNVLYSLAKGLGTLRCDESDTRFPTKRMPLGLLEYMVNFFEAEEMRKIPHCPKDYRLWQETMYVQFGQKWSKLHHGPLWSGGEDSRMDTMEARVNVPGLSERTLRRSISASGVTLTPEIQTSVLDEACRTHPNVWWWIKTDGCDLVSGLCESMKLEWSGDVDFNDGQLQKMHENYRQYLTFLSGIGLEDRWNPTLILEDLCTCSKRLAEDVSFVLTILKEKQDEYCEKPKTGYSNDKTLYELARKVRELSDLNEEGRSLHVEAKVLSTKIANPSYDIVGDNFGRQLSQFRERLLSFVKLVTRFHHTAATHILVVMISTKDRRSKLYALSIQLLPYVGIQDTEARTLMNKVIQEMVNRGMKVSGLTTNGEWNSLRTKGNTRPLSILQLRSEARAK